MPDCGSLQESFTRGALLAAGDEGRALQPAAGSSACQVCDTPKPSYRQLSNNSYLRSASCGRKVLGDKLGRDMGKAWAVSCAPAVQTFSLVVGRGVRLLWLQDQKIRSSWMLGEVGPESENESETQGSG